MFPEYEYLYMRNITQNIYVFDGQSSFKPGFGKQYLSNPEFRLRMEEISYFAGQDLGQLAWGKRSWETSKSLKNLQITIFALSWSLVHCLVFSNHRPTVLLGYGMGEISALIFSGAISVSDGVNLILARGELMEDLDRSDFQDQAGVNFPLFEEATSQFHSIIDKIQVQSPQIPFFSIEASRILSKPQEIQKYLKSHLSSPVFLNRAVEIFLNTPSMENCVFYEIGPSRVLKGLMIHEYPNFSISTAREYMNIARQNEKIQGRLKNQAPHFYKPSHSMDLNLSSRLVC